MMLPFGVSLAVEPLLYAGMRKGNFGSNSIALLCSVFFTANPVGRLFSALSCLFTKQHYLIDIPAGAALGWFTFKLFALVA